MAREVTCYCSIPPVLKRPPVSRSGMYKLEMTCSMRIVSLKFHLSFMMKVVIKPDEAQESEHLQTTTCLCFIINYLHHKLKSAQRKHLIELLHLSLFDPRVDSFARHLLCRKLAYKDIVF